MLWTQPVVRALARQRLSALADRPLRRGLGRSRPAAERRLPTIPLSSPLPSPRRPLIARALAGAFCR